MASEPQPGDLQHQFFLSLRHWWMTGDIVGVARFNKNLKLCTGIGLIFVFQPEYQTIKHSNFCHSALFCLDFLQAECHWRVNYVYAFSPLYFFPPPPCSLSPDVCKRANACWCECVCLQTNVCRLCFSFEHLFDVAVYLFISLPAKALFSAVRARADWARVALSAIHQRGASLTDEPVTSAPYSTSA